MYMMVCSFVVCKPPKTGFLASGPYGPAVEILVLIRFISIHSHFRHVQLLIAYIVGGGGRGGMYSDIFIRSGHFFVGSKF